MISASIQFVKILGENIQLNIATPKQYKHTFNSSGQFEQSIVGGDLVEGSIMALLFSWSSSVFFDFFFFFLMGSVTTSVAIGKE